MSCCVLVFLILLFFFFKQKTAYEMRISDWSSDVCSSDLASASGVRMVSKPGLNVPVICTPGICGQPVMGLSPFAMYASTGQLIRQQIGRASCRERVCQYV